MFLRSLWTKRTFLEFVMSLNLFGNGFGDVGEFIHTEFTSEKLSLFLWNLCDSAAVFKTGQVQEDQHSTVHAAWTANLLWRFRFPVWKRVERLVQ